MHKTKVAEHANNSKPFNKWNKLQYSSDCALHEVVEKYKISCILPQVESPGSCGERALMKSEASHWDFEATDIWDEKLATQPKRKKSATPVLEFKKHLKY